MRRLLCLLAFGNLVEEDRKTVRGRINAIFKPAVPRFVVILRLNEDLLRHRLLVSELKRLPYALRKLRPDMPPDKSPRLPAEKFFGLLVHVGISPVPVKSHKSVADAFDDIAQLPPGRISVQASGLLPREQS